MYLGRLCFGGNCRKVGMDENTLAGFVVVETDLPAASTVVVGRIVIVSPVFHIVAGIAVGSGIGTGFCTQHLAPFTGADVAYVDAAAAEINVVAVRRPAFVGGVVVDGIGQDDFHGSFLHQLHTAVIAVLVNPGGVGSAAAVFPAAVDCTESLVVVLGVDLTVGNGNRLAGSPLVPGAGVQVQQAPVEVVVNPGIDEYALPVRC